MTTTQLRKPAIARPRTAAGPEPGARISFRQPISGSGSIDAAWWPRSRDLAAELPALLDVLWTAAREINRVTYNLTAWDPAPRRVSIEGRTVRLGGFATSDPLTLTLLDAWGRERIDILVIAPGTEPAVAERALLLASVADSPYGAAEIIARASHPAADHNGAPS
jgi:Family of unknown function (DUF5994)